MCLGDSYGTLKSNVMNFFKKTINLNTLNLKVVFTYCF